MKKLITLFSSAYLLFAAAWLRIFNLGYSDYQGDEIKALFIPDLGESIYTFLLTQRKGPVQFIVTFLLKLIDSDYSNEFLVRLPFAMAGFLAIFFFYKFLKLYFGGRVALYSSLFMATNGFLIAFSRIVQYQSFVILFMALSLYVFSLALYEEKWKVRGIYLGFIFWALSILSHYDGIFIAPFVFYLLYRHVTADRVKFSIKSAFRALIRRPAADHRVRTIFLSSLIFTALLALFYIPFVFEISTATRDYWLNRISGGDGKISSSRYLFTVYQPIYSIHIYTILTTLGGFTVLYDLFRTHLYKRKDFTGVLKSPLLYLLAWAGIPFVFMEFLINIPGTHIYTYLIPLTVVMGYGLFLLEKITRKVFGYLTGSMVSTGAIFALFMFLFLQSHAIFVDHSFEYPWEQEKFFIWTFNKPSPIFHLSMFGFPYYRHWEEIGQFVTGSDNNGYYSTNERSSISRYFIPFSKDTDSAGHFVHIINPQSFTNELLSPKANYWAQKYDPVLTFIKNGKEIVKVYYMPEGSLDDIQALGY